MNKCLFSCRPIEPEAAATKWRRAAANTQSQTLEVPPVFPPHPF